MVYDKNVYFDPKCQGCRFCTIVGTLATCCYWEKMGVTRLSLYGHKLPLPAKCEQREGKKRGRPKKGTQHGD